MFSLLIESDIEKVLHKSKHNINKMMLLVTKLKENEHDWIINNLFTAENYILTE